MAGFPFRLEVRCDGASVSLVSQTAGQAATQTPITAKLGEILVVAQIYDPKLLIAEFTAPATISDRGGAAFDAANWSNGAQQRGRAAGMCRSAPRSCSTIPTIDRVDAVSADAAGRAPSMSNCTAASPKVRRPIIR